MGLNRLVLAMLCDAYDVETTPNGAQRTVLRLAPRLAPYQAAVISLRPKDPELAEVSRRVFSSLSAWTTADLDLGGGSVGKSTADRTRSEPRTASP